MGYIGAGVTRFNTADELTVTGDAEFNGNATFGDNVKAIFGAGSDLQIYHDGTNSFVTDAGTGNLRLQGSNYILIEDASGVDMMYGHAGAEVGLNYNGAVKLTTTSGGIDVTGTVTADGLVLDGNIYRSVDNQNIVIAGGTNDSGATIRLFGSTHSSLPSDMYFDADDHIFRSENAATTKMKITSGGDVSLYDSSGVTQGLFWDASTQRLGLGTTAPTKTLTVHGSDGTPLFLQGSGNDTAIAFAHSGTTNAAINSSNDGAIEFRSGGGGSADEVMRITSGGNVGIGTTSPEDFGSGHRTLQVEGNSTNGGIVKVCTTSDAEEMIMYVDSSGGTVNVISNDPLMFRTNNTERMRIDSSGNVGIGTTTPSTPLNVKTHSGSWEVCQLQNTYGTSAALIRTIGAAGGSVDFGCAGNSASTAILRTNGTERMRVDSSGNVGIGTTNPDSKLFTIGDSGSWVYKCFSAGSGAQNLIAFNLSSGGSAVGSITSNGSSTSYNTTSDHRLKENVTEVTGAADRVKALNPVRFNFISNPDTTVDGFLAHEVQDIVPEAITGAKDAVDDEGNIVPQAIDQSKLVPLLTAALQEALTKIDDLETRLAALEAN